MHASDQHIDPNQTVGSLVVERPARARVFERFGLDYCCGGKRSLSVACAGAGVALDEMLDELDRADEQPSLDEVDWSVRSMTELADHIEQTHHAFLREELPRLETLGKKVVQAHGERNPKWFRLAEVFRQFKAEMEHHMTKEERMLFPAIRAIESFGALPSHFPFRTVHNPILIMLREHDDAGDAIAQMRELTDGFTPAPGDCNTVCALLDGLAAVERDTHQHVHKENNILFPRAEHAEAFMPG